MGANSCGAAVCAIPYWISQARTEATAGKEQARSPLPRPSERCNRDDQHANDRSNHGGQRRPASPNVAGSSAVPTAGLPEFFTAASPPRPHGPGTPWIGAPCHDRYLPGMGFEAISHRIALAVLGMAGAFLLPAQTQRYHQYSVSTTGVPYGSGSIVYDCNNAGEILLGTHVWRPGIGLVALPPSVTWLDLNDRSEVVGRGGGGTTGWLHSLTTGVTTALSGPSPTGPGLVPFLPTYTNDQGDICGQPLGGGAFEWLRLANGTYQTLAWPVGVGSLSATALGCDGVFAQFGTTGSYFWLYPSGPVPVQLLAPAFRFRPLASIDCSGTWAGIAETFAGTNMGIARRSAQGSVFYYPRRFSSQHTSAHRINSAGNFVDSSGGGGAWLTTSDMVVEIGRLLQPGPFQLSSAQGLTDQGQIVAEGYFGSSRQIAILTPTTPTCALEVNTTERRRNLATGEWEYGLHTNQPAAFVLGGGEANAPCGIALIDNAGQIVAAIFGLTDYRGMWTWQPFVPAGPTGTFRFVAGVFDTQAGLLVSSPLTIYLYP